MFFYSEKFFLENFKKPTPPSFLHHYTSIETLALILKNRTIRFNRADKVNDPYEAKTSTLGLIQKGTYISCWTATEVDAIPMWNMYSNNMKGIRLTFPSNLFLGRKKIKFWGDGGFAMPYGKVIKLHRSHPGFDSSTNIIEGPNPVYYTNNNDIINNDLFYPFPCEDNHVSLQTYGVALAKPESWKHEQEWRFKIMGIPQSLTDSPLNFFLEHYNFENQPCIEEYVDLEIDPSSLSELQILLGPRCGEAEKIIINALVDAYSPNAKINNSTIKVK
ncbi:DUF2971 domain-containing protein [Aeromonas sobria]|uniref:DUF2971 domain-containing protein n=1 Tax=Aeromonas sobria TaxID=646 RepID=UPI000C6ECFF0|nr:DUF2971 domain-containing protein [Aeromonas sobria]PKQ73946.1 hypothetical protein CJF47_14585 [Aeromonas sobria]